MSGVLSASPSSGYSEVFGTLRVYQPLGRRAIPITRLARLISRTYKADDELGGDSAFETDLLAVLQAMNGDGYITPHPAATSDSVKLTSAGRVEARHHRPRARRDPWGGH